MRSLLSLLVLALLAVLIYQQYHAPHLRLNRLSERILSPLDTRLRYTIAPIDPRFQISHAEVLQLAQQATQIWQDGTGREYFVYDPNARLEIVFIYDQRQQQSQQRKIQLSNIETQQQHWLKEKQQVDQNKQQLQKQQQLIQQEKLRLEQQYQHFYQLLQTIDASKMPNLQQQLHQLKQDSLQLNQRSMLLNQKILKINQQVDQTNQLNHQIEQQVEKFNQNFRPYRFDKGSFNGRKITIYEFQSKADLKLTLAHEFGHALGLQHSDDPKALMYPIMKDQDMQHFSLTPADLALFK